MKVLLLEPGASWSTADVSTGLEHGLKHHGVDVIKYRLDTRIARSANWLHYNWRKAKKANPAKEKPTIADVFYQAGSESILTALRHQVDVVLIVSAMYVHPDLIVLMKRAGLRVVVLFTESPYDLDQEMAIAKLVDGCWTCERSSVAAFGEVTRAGYLPHAWYSERHQAGAQDGDEAVRAHDVVFVGSGFQERIEWLKAIDWTGIDFGLYGSWELLGSRHPLRRHVAGQITDNATAAALYRRAKIGLNLYRTSKGFGKAAPRITHAESLNPRAYELARCGAFTLSTHRAEVSEVFGDLVPTFETPAEASALIRRWLADDAGRAAIQSQLPARVVESSWVERATHVIGDIQSLLLERAA